MRMTLAIASLVGLGAASSTLAWAQTNDPATASSGANSPAPVANAGQPIIIRDPRTGLLYQQELQTVDQPVTTWQRKVVERTVVTPQTVYENQQIPQTVYVAKTEYVLQPKLKGWWNPLAEPTYAYEYVPVTRWVPQTQMLTRQVPTVKLIPRTEQIPIDEPVQSTQKVTQVVLRPLPANSPASTLATNSLPTGQSAAAATNSLASSPYRHSAATAWQAPNAPQLAAVPTYQAIGQPSQALIASLPVLSQQRPLGSLQPGTLLSAPVHGLRSIVRSAAAPFQTQATYGAPTSMATLPSTSSRDFNQAGMPATVLR